MTSNSEALTPEQVKQNLRAQGKTLKQVGIENNLEPSDVYKVMNGSRKVYMEKVMRLLSCLD